MIYIINNQVKIKTCRKKLIIKTLNDNDKNCLCSSNDYKGLNQIATICMKTKYS